MKRSILVLLLVVFGGIVLHAPLSVGFGSLFPEYEFIIKSWKEVVMGIVGILIIMEMARRRMFGLLRDPLFLFIGIFILLHIILLFILWQGWLPSLAGLLIDLRYLIFFILVYLALKLYPEWRTTFLNVGIGGALLVAVFGVLQVTILPHDVLKHIGYSETTIMPYLTVDDNPDFVRINSTLRGPNPLGAYMAIILAGVAAYLWRGRVRGRRAEIISAILAASALICLWVSYSRSAWLAAVVAVFIVAVVVWSGRISWRSWKVWTWVGMVGIIFITGIAAFQATPWGNTFISNVVLHENAETGADISSNDGHIDSLQSATQVVMSNPIGVGVGSTGSASLLGEKPYIVENQFFFVAHETGWLGLLLFVLIWLGVLSRLWQERGDWLALAVFASGIGMAIIGLLLPVWVDDTVSLIWWGLAAIVLAAPRSIIKE